MIAKLFLLQVSDKAGVCPQFLKGFCPNGADCNQRHVLACPEFDRTGACSKDAKCPFPHVSKDDGEDRTKKKAPAKPKRKSLGPPNEQSLKKSRVTSRYFEDTSQQQPEVEVEAGSYEDLEEKRKRIMKKLECAKQSWRASMVNPEENTDVSLNDSGPYEKIKDESRIQEEETPRRPPVGTLGDFISLSGYSSGEENQQDRLI